ncbi:PRD domain-containing protein [Anaeromicropila herbilytica]|uniref:Transcription antiterminator BglG n=1 Tax=Anaeromicropila herbilytica TaxID=2785025 RepID=A0A7R7EM79_9FIRM|nr:PRD domain-containing protein [Anaeromicropila herbilytica]BCN31333.1 transcription antiterminator BglG [Anaeromicropila herbilytica]
MFQVIKVLNNNGILALNKEDKKEIIFIGKGIGFQFKKDEIFSNIEDAKRYGLQEDSEKGSSINIINSVDPIFLDITHEIILVAEKKFGKVDNNILIPLADHIAFSIERIKNNMLVSNPFALDIKALFEEEYEVALKGKAIIKEMTGYDINDDEVGYITLHIHSALSEERVSQSMRVAIIVRETIEKIENEFNIKIDINSLSYNRLMSHIKYMVARVMKGEVLNLDMSPYMKKEFPYSYQVAEDVCKQLSKEFRKEFSDVEVGYLAIHIERVRNLEQKEE